MCCPSAMKCSGFGLPSGPSIAGHTSTYAHALFDLAVRANQLVCLVHLLGEMPAGGCGLQADGRRSASRKGRPNHRVERPEIRTDRCRCRTPRRSFSPGYSTTTRGAWGSDDPTRVPGAVGHFRSAESAVHWFQIGERLARFPPDDARGADEDDAAFCRRICFVLGLELLNRRLKTIGIDGLLRRQPQSVARIPSRARASSHDAYLSS